MRTPLRSVENETLQLTPPSSRFISRSPLRSDVKATKVSKFTLVFGTAPFVSNVFMSFSYFPFILMYRGIVLSMTQSPTHGLLIPPK